MDSIVYSNKKICIIGDVMLDHYIHGNCNRISPEAPVPVVEVTGETYSLGGAANVLKNIYSLGFEADLISLTGNDDHAEIIIDGLVNCKASTSGIIKDTTRCTTTKSRVIVTNHQLIRLDNEHRHPLNKEYEMQILAYFESQVDNYKLVLLSDYNKGLLTPSLLDSVLQVCRSKGLTTIVDPKGLDFTKYRGVDIVKPNKKEASLASGIDIVDNDTLKAACHKIKELTDCKYVIVTMSEDGIAVYSDGQLSLIPTKALAIIDVTGAGDTVLAALGVAVASGMHIDEACNFANSAAAVVISKIGSATVTMDEISVIMGYKLCV